MSREAVFGELGREAGTIYPSKDEEASRHG
jgi:hypothetical protein